MVNVVLQALFNLTGSRAISGLIGERRANQRWKARVAAHVAGGGSVVTVSGPGGEATYLAVSGANISVLA